VTFRLKLLVSMVALVVAVTGAVLFVTQRDLRRAQQARFQTEFENEVTTFAALQATRLAAVKVRLSELARSPRLRAALEEGEVEMIYLVAGDELRHFFEERTGDAETGPSTTTRASFVRFVDGQGRVLAPPAGRGTAQAFPEDGQRLDEEVGRICRSLAEAQPQALGYLAPETGDGTRLLHEIILTKVRRLDADEVGGALVIGFPVPLAAVGAARSSTPTQNAIWLGGRVYSASLPEASQGELAERVAAVHRASPSRSGEFAFALNGEPFRVFCRPLATGAQFPQATHVSLFSLAEALRQERALRNKVLTIGGAALAATVLLGVVLAGKLAAQIEALKAGTTQIGKGNYQVKVPVLSADETGSLAVSFNQMAEGLALKEKYRSVLNVVADAKVAQRLIDGGVALGGETREISVLFCDIRGFTALTQNMDPGEVIRLLNEHFEPLTRVVNEHHGVVDKFVGDLIMAVFGAPESHGNDAANSVNCARAMIGHRSRLNETAHYPIRMGIGIASGPAVAGCMGSSDRLNYTVLGERVNLASRLCGQAGPMEIVIDQTTRERLGEAISVEPMAALKLKGFSAPVQAYKLVEPTSTTANA
jgi:class 3 adenylate cyclase